MNHTLLLLSDSQSEDSFNSSQFCSIGQRTASIDLNMTNNNLQNISMTPKMKTRSIDQSLSQKTVSIQKPRIQHISQKNIFQKQGQFQLGFVMGKNKKNIAFNESKIKKVKNFFDQDDLTFHENSFQTHSLFQFPKKQQSKLAIQDSVIHQMSNPCFQNFGKKQKVQIDQNLLEKAKNFFNDDIQESCNILPSFKKPTKVKKPFHQPQKSQNFIKTVNVNKNKKKPEVKKVEKKQVFDWNNFFYSSSKNNLDRQKSIKKSSGKKSQNLKSNKKSKSNIVFQKITLKDLNTNQLQNEQKRKRFIKNMQNFLLQTFNHVKSNCKIIKCLLCDIGIELMQINIGKLEQIFTNKLILEKIDTEIFTKLFQQIYFKLQKYEIFYPELINKRLNPSNILIQMHKKSKLIEKGNPCLGWLDYCIKENKFYHSFIAQVREIYHNQKIKTFFFKLSDGWSNVWAIITQKNYLYQYLHKVRIFSKIFIGYWKNYSLGNILSFCPSSKEKQKCIQIWYNSSILLRENTKIGKPGGLIFYRPLNKNHKQGGLIPTVQGVVLRMFCAFSQSKKKSFYSSTDQTFNDNYVEIITPQGYSVLMKFILPSQRSLAQLFRLYYRYQFYFVKIGLKDNILQFNDGISKFFEFDKKDKKLYDKQLIDVIKKRYINSMNDIKLERKLKVGQLYDIFMEGNQCNVNGLKFVIDNNNENETVTNSYFKGGSLLYQQYKLDKIRNSCKESSQSQIFILRKTKFSNTLKTLPAIYKQINHLN